MQWNTINMTKEEIKKRQEKYIKDAMEMSKKAKSDENNSITKPVVFDISINENPAEIKEETMKEAKPNTQEKKEEIYMVNTSDVSQKVEKAQEALIEEEITETITYSDDTGDFTTANDEPETEDIAKSAEEIFANVFISEEEAEEKLKEVEKAFEEISEEIPNFNKYIETHNKENTDTNNTSNANE